MQVFQLLGYFSYPLGLMAFIAITIVIERFIFFNFRSSAKKLAPYKKLIDDNNKLEKPLRDELVSNEFSILVKEYYFGVKMLRMIAVLSPMIGLLGTVIGIIQAFEKISGYEGQVTPALIADGLWMAMVTTAAGLVIAIPVLFFAFLFSRTAESKTENLSRELNKYNILGND